MESRVWSCRPSSRVTSRRSKSMRFSSSTRMPSIWAATVSKRDWKRRQLLRFQSRFETVAAQIDGILVELEKRIDLLRRDVTLLDGLHDQTRDSIGALDTYIAAGKAFVEEYRTGPLVELQAKAK